MSSPHTVAEGETLVTIAHANGFRDWAPIWNAAENADLRELRKNPMTLVPGDVVQIPEKEVLSARCETNKKHRFTVKALVAHFKFNLMDSEGRAVVGARYELKVGDEVFEGKTGDEGLIEHEVPHDASVAKLTAYVDPQGDPLVWNMQIGALKPITEVEGLEARLANLGYDVGTVDGVADESTKAAIKHFQFDHGLPATGELDDETRDRIDHAYKGF